MEHGIDIGEVSVLASQCFQQGKTASKQHTIRCSERRHRAPVAIDERFYSTNRDV
jgi:hypothetical protein